MDSDSSKLSQLILPRIDEEVEFDEGQSDAFIIQHLSSSDDNDHQGPSDDDHQGPSDDDRQGLYAVVQHPSDDDSDDDDESDDDDDYQSRYVVEEPSSSDDDHQGQYAVPIIQHPSDDNDDHQGQSTVTEIQPASSSDDNHHEVFQSNANLLPEEMPLLQGPALKSQSSLGNLSCLIVFYTQLAVISLLAVILFVRAFRSYHLHLATWLAPLFTATGAATIYAMAWLQLSINCPEFVLKLCFFLSPILSCSLGVMFLYANKSGNLIGIASIFFGVAQLLYVRRTVHRFLFCGSVLSDASENVRRTTSSYLIGFSILGSAIYSSFLICSIVGPIHNIRFMAMMLLSLMWTISVVKNSIIVLLSRIAYVRYTRGVDLKVCDVTLDLFRHTMGSITFATVVIPLCGLVGVLGRALRWMSCGRAGGGAATWAARGFNWCGLVHVGVSRYGFIESSIRTWDKFKEVKMEKLIEADMTRVFCFVSGAMGGTIAALVAGWWVIAYSHAMELMFYAFFIGYIVTRVSTAWHEAVIGAYHVGYADNTTNPGLDTFAE